MRRQAAAGSVAAIVLLLAGFASGPVAAAGTLTVEPPSGVPGQTLTAKGSGFPAGQHIELRWDGTGLPEGGPSGEDGSFEIAFAIPSAAAVGGHELRACIRGNCSLAPPFTVAVIAAPPPTIVPSANPSAAPTPPPSTPSSPAPSTPSGSALPTRDPAASASPGASVSPDASASTDASASPAVQASASGGLAGQTVAPTALPGDPDAPGTVKVQFPWDRVLVAGLVGLSVLLLFYAWASNDNRLLRSRSGNTMEGTSNEKWMKDRTAQGVAPKPHEVITAGGDASAPTPKTPKLYEAMTKGTHAPPAAPQADAAVEPGAAAEPSPDAAPGAEPDSDPSKDVKLKGKKIGEN